MSAVAERARVAVLLADYAAADAGGKINILGAGWAISGIDPSTASTAPQSVVVMIDSPPDLYGVDFAVTLTLRDGQGKAVRLPGPVGQPESMRISQLVRAEEPQIAPEANVPRGTIWAHAQIVLNLAGGLPLSPGQLYSWQLDIDGTEDARWAAYFYVPGPRPGPVFGGPDGPLDIPDVPRP